MFRKSLNIVIKKGASAFDAEDIVIKKGASAFDAEALFLFSGKLFTGLENSVTRRRNYALIIVV